MKFQKFWNKYENCIIAILTILVNIAAMAVCFDYYYDLNDDVMMKDVMAGVYAGTPDGHNMQTLYPLGAFISLCYRLCRALPWYGLFLCLCQIGSLFLIGYRLLAMLKKWQAKIGCMIVLTLFIWGVILPHMIALQYTVTCTMMASTAIFLFMTTPKDLTPKQFIICNIPSILLVILAYQLRSEMLLLVFPLICLAGLYRWIDEEKFFRKENYIKYGVVIACILVGMLGSRLTDFIAYSGGGWKDAVEFFDKRTEVYDFHYDILTSGEHREYLSSIGLSDASQELLANYNFGLDENIDEKLMGKIADYAADSTVNTRSFMQRLSVQMRLYIYRTLHGGDFPYNLFVISGYIFVFVSGVYSALKGDATKKRWAFLWELIILGIVRTILWMYIMMKGRDPERITHSLYLAESMVLMGLFCIRNFLTPIERAVEDGQGGKEPRKLLGSMCAIPFIYLLLSAAVFLANLFQSVVAVKEDARKREEANRGADAISQYCRSQPENFYFEDVYSTVSFSQKIFKNIDNSLTNYDIMGGWMCKTPLYGEKLRQFGIENTQDGLLSEDGVYFIIEIPEAEYANTDWLIEYYQDKGYEVSLRQIDLIADRYAVYQVVEE